MHPDQLDGEMLLAPGFCTPPNTVLCNIAALNCTLHITVQDYNGYHNYINNNLPAESPHLYGLHPNAEIGFLTATSEKMFKVVFELQPRESGGDSAQSSSREDKVGNTSVCYNKALLRAKGAEYCRRRYGEAAGTVQHAGADGEGGGEDALRHRLLPGQLM